MMLLLAAMLGVATARRYQFICPVGCEGNPPDQCAILPEPAPEGAKCHELGEIQCDCRNDCDFIDVCNPGGFRTRDRIFIVRDFPKDFCQNSRNRGGCVPHIRARSSTHGIPARDPPNNFPQAPERSACGVCDNLSPGASVGIPPGYFIPGRGFIRTQPPTSRGTFFGQNPGKTIPVGSEKTGNILSDISNEEGLRLLDEVEPTCPTGCNPTSQARLQQVCGPLNLKKIQQSVPCEALDEFECRCQCSEFTNPCQGEKQENNGSGPGLNLRHLPKGFCDNGGSRVCLHRVAQLSNDDRDLLDKIRSGELPNEPMDLKFSRFNIPLPYTRQRFRSVDEASVEAGTPTIVYVAVAGAAVAAAVGVAYSVTRKPARFE